MCCCLRWAWAGASTPPMWSQIPRSASSRRSPSTIRNFWAPPWPPSPSRRRASSSRASPWSSLRRRTRPAPSSSDRPRSCARPFSSARRISAVARNMGGWSIRMKRVCLTCRRPGWRAVTRSRTPPPPSPPCGSSILRFPMRLSRRGCGPWIGPPACNVSCPAPLWRWRRRARRSGSTAAIMWPVGGCWARPWPILRRKRRVPSSSSAAPWRPRTPPGSWRPFGDLRVRSSRFPFQANMRVVRHRTSPPQPPGRGLSPNARTGWRTRWRASPRSHGTGRPAS